MPWFDALRDAPFAPPQRGDIRESENHRGVALARINDRLRRASGAARVGLIVRVRRRCRSCPKTAGLGQRSALDEASAAPKPPHPLRAPFPSPLPGGDSRLLRLRAVPAVEQVEDARTGARYRRRFAKGDSRFAGKLRRSLVLEVPHRSPRRSRESDRVRRLFDLDADPARIGARLREDPRLAPLSNVGSLRVPRAFDAAELAARAILANK